MGHHFKYATYRVAGTERLIDNSLHALFGSLVHAAKQNFLARLQCQDLRPARIAIELCFAHSNDVACHRDSQSFQQLLGNRPGGHPRRGFARRGPLQNISCIRKIVFQRACRSACPGRGEATALCFAGSPASTGRISVQFFQSLFSIRSKLANQSSSHVERRRESAPCPAQSSCGRRGHTLAAAATIRDSFWLHQWAHLRACQKPWQSNTPRAILLKWQNETCSNPLTLLSIHLQRCVFPA